MKLGGNEQRGLVVKKKSNRQGLGYEKLLVIDPCSSPAQFRSGYEYGEDRILYWASGPYSILSFPYTCVGCLVLRPEREGIRIVLVLGMKNLNTGGSNFVW